MGGVPRICFITLLLFFFGGGGSSIKVSNPHPPPFQPPPSPPFCPQTDTDLNGSPHLLGAVEEAHRPHRLASVGGVERMHRRRPRGVVHVAQQDTNLPLENVKDLLLRVR